MHFIRFIFFIIKFVYVLSRTSDILKVKLSHGGVLVGRYLTSHNGKGIRGFLGIPYAEPPLGDLRFAPPLPALPWEGEKLVQKDSDICIQKDPFRRDEEVTGSEDCLYLNVYAPQFPKTNASLPVMVFFHGGGWECGSGISQFYGPEYILNHDVIYVSGNFRLGILGFLSTETIDCPGNNGLKDQVEILKWVQNNIGSFGGDPNKVTIFGESAGGASVTYHMFSPMSKGLFHRGISESGTYLNPWAYPEHKGYSSKKAQKLSKIFNCNIKKRDWKALIKCLRKIPAKNITNALDSFFKWDKDPIIPFPPTVEPIHEGAFLKQYPREIISPHGLSLPWIAGLTSDEGAIKSAPIANIPSLLKKLKNEFNEALPIILGYSHHPKDKSNEITKSIDKFYFNMEHDFNKVNHQNLTNIFTDGLFLHGILEYLKGRLNTANIESVGPTFVYLFDHKGEASFTEIFKGGKEDFYGVCHAEELQYLFPIGKSLFINSAPTKLDNQVQETMVNMWVNFAYYGNPTPTESELTKWKPTTKFPINYVRIGSRDRHDETILRNENGLFEERFSFWDSLGAYKPIASKRDEL